MADAPAFIEATLALLEAHRKLDEFGVLSGFDPDEPPPPFRVLKPAGPCAPEFPSGDIRRRTEAYLRSLGWDRLRGGRRRWANHRDDYQEVGDPAATSDLIGYLLGRADTSECIRKGLQAAGRSAFLKPRPTRSQP